MTTVEHLLEHKGRQVWSIDPNATVFDAIAMMANEGIGSLVVKEEDKILGILTERHYTRNVFLKGRASPTTLVRDIMEN